MILFRETDLWISHPSVESGATAVKEGDYCLDLDKLVVHDFSPFELWRRWAIKRPHISKREICLVKDKSPAV